VNQRLLDGQTGPVILAWLNALPEVQAVMNAHFEGQPINAENLSAWRRGAWQKWCDDREDVEQTREMAALSARLAEAAGGDMSAGARAIAAGKIMTALQSLDANTDQKLIGKLTENAVSLSLAEVAKRKGSLDARKVDQADKALALDERKFQRQTTELFLKWFDNEQTRRIAEGKGTKETKVAKLVQLWFGQMPEGIGPPMK
jgi:hypothetical protein